MTTAMLPFIEDEALRQQQLFDDAPVAYHEIDGHGIVRRVNSAECELLGLERQQLLGRPVWELVTPEERNLSRQAVIDKLGGRKPLCVFERSYCQKNGEALRVEIHERLIRDEEGRVIGIRSAMFDISRRLRAERQLRDSHRWLVATLRSIPEGVIAVDAMATKRRLFDFLRADGAFCATGADPMRATSPSANHRRCRCRNWFRRFSALPNRRTRTDMHTC